MRIRRRDGWALCLTEDVDSMSGRRKIYQFPSDVRWGSSPGIRSAHLRLPKQIHGGPEPVFEGSDLTRSTIKCSVMAALTSPQAHFPFKYTKNVKKTSTCAWPFSPFFSKKPTLLVYVCFQTQTSVYMCLNLEYCDYKPLYHYLMLKSARKQKLYRQTPYVLLFFGV